jgi:hypothetical protein
MLLKISLLMAGLVLSIGIMELHILTLQIVEEMHTRIVTSQCVYSTVFSSPAFPMTRPSYIEL